MANTRTNSPPHTRRSEYRQDNPGNGNDRQFQDAQSAGAGSGRAALFG